ncbi:hypothetical protein NL676_014974 [Syzygium grande]|nr:hypothetical protein NL676_014974 [Syzygium grande]
MRLTVPVLYSTKYPTDSGNATAPYPQDTTPPPLCYLVHPPVTIKTASAQAMPIGLGTTESKRERTFCWPNNENAVGILPIRLVRANACNKKPEVTGLILSLVTANRSRFLRKPIFEKNAVTSSWDEPYL